MFSTLIINIICPGRIIWESTGGLYFSDRQLKSKIYMSGLVRSTLSFLITLHKLYKPIYYMLLDST